MRSFAAACCRASAFVWLAISAGAVGATPPAVDAFAAARIARFRVPFVPNHGQSDPQVAFLARTFAGTVFVTRDGRVVYSLAPSPLDRAAKIPGWAISETFVHGRAPTPFGVQPGTATVSDFVGSTDASRANLPTFDRVGLGEVAPGIAVELRAAGSNVEKVFTVEPGADPASIGVRIDGATRLLLADGGGLRVATGIGELQFTSPIAYQEVGSSRVRVDVHYRLDAAANEYGFIVGSYDRSKPLVIDPLIKSTYSGGDATDVIRAVLVHPGSGQVYVAGSTTSTSFPTITGPLTTNVIGTDAYVARYTAGLNSLQKVLFYGAAGEDSANAIAILNSTGNIYIAGRTSSATGLPGVVGLYNGGIDAYVVRFDGALQTVLGGAYFGGTLEDGATGLAVDNMAGEIVMVGDTRSATIPVGATSGAQTTPGGGQDGFVARFTASLGLIRSSFIGGSADDAALAVAIDPIRSDVIVAGATQSTNFPGVANGAMPSPGGLKDGFVARFNSSLSTRLQSSYFGGSADDEITAIAVHPFTSNVYVTGNTASTNLRGRIVGQAAKATGIDAFVASFYPEITGVQAVTYFGGDGDDFGTGIAINPASGEIYLTGHSASSTLPGSGFGVQPTNAAAGVADAFVARFDIGLVGPGPKQSTLLGGTGVDKAYAIALSDTSVFIAGETASGGFPGVAPNSAQGTPGGGASDGFVSAMTTDLRAASSNPSPFTIAPVVNALPLAFKTSAPTQITPNGNATVYVDGQPGSSWCASTGPNCTCDLTGNLFQSGTLTMTATLPYYVCVRQLSSAAPNEITEATLHIGSMAATFRVGTGTITGLGCTLDADGDGNLSALTDGLIVIRALFGLTGTAVTNGAIGANAARPTWSDISSYFNENCGTNFAP